MMGALPYEAKKYLYWDWVRSEATLIDTDGCSGVSGFRLDCCLEHDLGYYYGRDPRDAYRHYIEIDGVPEDYWSQAAKIDRKTVDARFRKCNQVKSKCGRWSPMALWRWIGVRIGGKKSWDEYRLERP